MLHNLLILLKSVWIFYEDDEFQMSISFSWKSKDWPSHERFAWSLVTSRHLWPKTLRWPLTTCSYIWWLNSCLSRVPQSGSSRAGKKPQVWRLGSWKLKPLSVEGTIFTEPSNIDFQHVILYSDLGAGNYNLRFSLINS